MRRPGELRRTLWDSLVYCQPTKLAAAPAKNIESSYISDRSWSSISMQILLHILSIWFPSSLIFIRICWHVPIVWSDMVFSYYEYVGHIVWNNEGDRVCLLSSISCHSVSRSSRNNREEMRWMKATENYAFSWKTSDLWPRTMDPQ